MHGQQNIKICNAEQAKHLYRYKNIKTKLYKCKATIWYNKTCRIKHVTPRYINIKVSGDNKRGQNTKNAAIRHRISQELKFQYAKKQQLNEQLHKTHLEFATQWTTIWQMIQSKIDSKIQQEMEAHYNHLAKKWTNCYKTNQKSYKI